MSAANSARRKQLLGLLGDLPDHSRKITVKKLSEEKRPNYVLEKLLLDLNGIEPAPAYFLRPHGQKGRAPTILYNHAHGRVYELGKDELLNGRVQLLNPPYADLLTSLGYSVLCFDTWCFGERRGRAESEMFKEMLWNGQVMWGMMVYDSLRAIDYLVSRPDVDVDRIGTLGLSMGSTMAWWVAALDERVKVCVDMCCLTDFHSLIQARNLDGHGLYYYVPALLKHFDTAQINALISPRAHLSVAGSYDLLTPPSGLDKIDAALRKVYAADGAPDAWRLTKYAIGHFETATMRVEIVEFLGKWM